MAEEKVEDPSAGYRVEPIANSVIFVFEETRLYIDSVPYEKLFFLKLRFKLKTSTSSFLLVIV